MNFYKVLSILLFPFLEIYLFYRVFKKKEDKKRLKERFGKPTKERPQGDLVWFHAVSVGEANSALILAEEMLKKSPNISILFTTTTLTSASILAKKEREFSGKLIHQFLPIDSYFCALAFIEFWQPKKAIFVESEIWPNLISILFKKEIPAFLINARMKKRSFKRWRLAKIFGLRIFDKFSEIISQTKKDVENFEKLSGKKVHFFGNLKSQAKVLEVDEQELQKLQNEIGNRKIFLAASTHEGEEKIILNIHQELKKKFSNLLTIIAIRHPNRSEEVANLINVKFVKRTDKKQIQNDDEIYLVDTLGELGVFYSLVDFTFIGGSISKNGGHNPYEAIKLNSAVISGKNIFNFKEIYNELEENNACEIVDNEDQMLEKIEEFLTKEEKSTKLQINAQQLISRKKDVISELILIINR